MQDQGPRAVVPGKPAGFSGASPDWLWGERSNGKTREGGTWKCPEDFPVGPPPKYYPDHELLNFGGQKRSGVFNSVWPSAKMGGC